MKKYIKKYEEKFGYTPSVSELYNQYTKGLLSLSDNEENTLIKEIGLKISDKCTDDIRLFLAALRFSHLKYLRHSSLSS